MEKSERLISLDVFRGMTIAGMILVNHPGSGDYVYAELAHAEWNGCTFADFIFPFFLFIVGVAITLSLSKRKESGANKTKLYIQIFRRSFIIFLLGFILGLVPSFSFENIVYTGILKRIAVVYFFTSIIFLNTSLKTQSIMFASFLLIYWGLLTLVPVPGIGEANLGKETNLGAWFDRLLMSGHLAHETWDPQGVLNTLPAILTSLLGVLTGYLLKSDKDQLTKTVYMFAAGNVLLLAGYVFDFWFPINKNLWSSSFVLFTGGFALNIFALCYWFIDIKKYTWWTKPFLVFGTNAITVYFLAVIINRLMKFYKVGDGENLLNIKAYLFQTFFMPYFAEPMNASLAYSICYVLIWLGLMWILYYKKIFIKV